jgi:hypothetical protein
VHNIKHLWVIMWHIFTSTNNTTTIVFPTQLRELLYTYHVIKQCTEKETTSLSNLLLTIKLNYLHDHKIMFQCLLNLITYIIEKRRMCMCNKSIICAVLFASKAIIFYEGNNMLSALLWVLRTLYHGQE